MISQYQIIDIGTHVSIGLAWDEVKDKEIDLDLQCIFLNDLGIIEDAVYYNQLHSKIAQVSHSGDSQGGKKVGFDEVLTLNLKQMTFGIKYVAVLVCSYKKEPFSSAENARISLFQKEFTISSKSVGGMGENLSYLPFIFDKQSDGTWWVTETNYTGQGSTFIECEDVIKQGLISLGFDSVLLQESKDWTGQRSFPITKEDTLMVPPQMKGLIVGLGWDTKCDIDSSILCFDETGKLLENIYYGNKQSKNCSIIHHGDHLTGEGQGDDEQITLHLDKIDSKVKCIWSVITIFSYNNQFDDVNGAFCRVFDPVTKKEFCRFNLSENRDGVCNGNIMCCLTRHKDNMWSISPKGYYTKGTKCSQNMVPIISQIITGNFSQVVILQPEFNFQIKIVKGKDLGAFDFFNGLSDPYVELHQNSKQIGKTKTIFDNLNPVWNESFKVKLDIDDLLEFKMYDYDRFLYDDFMGTCRIQLNQQIMESYQPQEFTLYLMDKSFQFHEKYKGTLLVVLKKIR